MRYIKTIAAATLLSASVFVQAQKSLVYGIDFYLKQTPPELENAKLDIDNAAKNPSTANWGDMWYWRGKTYMFIASYKPELDANAGSISVQSFINYLKATDKKTESDVEELLGSAESDICYLVTSAGSCYNEAAKYLQEGKGAEAIKRYELIIEMIPFDKNERLTKYNLTKNQMLLACYTAAVNDSNTVLSREYLQKLIENKYNDPKLYMFLAQSYQKEGDTDKAIEYLEKGLKVFPDDAKMFLIEEINLYLSKGETDALRHKLDLAIETDPSNELLYFNRGILSQEKHLYGKAQADFEKVLELKPDYGDAKVSLGSVLLDSGKVLTAQMEKIKDVKSKQYLDLQAQSDNLFKKALPILEQVYNEGIITKPEDVISLLRTIRDIHAQLHDEAKRAEYNALIKQKKQEFKMD